MFITQGGLQSTDEALAAGVPLIGIPMLGDQWFNVEKYVHHNIGLQLEIGTLQVESFKNAIETVIGDMRYVSSFKLFYPLAGEASSISPFHEPPP